MPSRPTVPPQVERSRNAYDLLRLVAALAVAGAHIVYWTGKPFLWLSYSASDPTTPYWFNDGVPLFFILSGMLVFGSAQRCLADGRPLRQFYANRGLRIWPALAAFAALAVTIAVAVGAVHDVYAAVAWAAPVVLLLPPGSRPLGALGDVDGQLWTVPVEVTFYLILPLLTIVGRRIGFTRLLLALYPLAILGLAAGTYLAPASHNGGSGLLHATVIPYFWFFLLGMTLWSLGDRLPMRASIAIGCGLVYVLSRNAYFTETEDAIGVLPARALGAIPLAYLAQYLGLRLWRAGRLLHRQDISYGVYVWHMFVMGLGVYLAAQTGAAALSSPYLLIPATIGVGLASWKLVERRALSHKPFTSRQAERPSASEQPPTRVPEAQSSPMEPTASTAAAELT